MNPPLEVSLLIAYHINDSYLTVRSFACVCKSAHRAVVHLSEWTRYKFTQLYVACDPRVSWSVFENYEEARDFAWHSHNYGCTMEDRGNTINYPVVFKATRIELLTREIHTHTDDCSIGGCDYIFRHK